MGVKMYVDIQRPMEDVFVFASNAVNLPLYDNNIREVKKITEGPIGIGSIFHLISNQFGIRMNVVLVFTAYEPSHHFAFRVISGPFPIETHYSLESLESRTQVSGEREPQLRGIWKSLIPLVSIPARQKFEAELNNLKSYLETHS